MQISLILAEPTGPENSGIVYMSKSRNAFNSKIKQFLSEIRFSANAGISPRFFELINHLCEAIIMQLHSLFKKFLKKQK